ncbi:two-component regulator propeller domain-containing protein [Paludibacter sp.]
MKKGILTIVIASITLVLFGQTDKPVAMGKWRTHLAYNSISQIAQSSSNIYAVSDGALISINKNDGDMQFYSKMSGLSDVNIKRIEYDAVNKQVLIIYSNGNIDIMHSSGVYNIHGLYNKVLGTSKGINEIIFDGKFAYLSCDFGIIKLNMQNKEISDTYIIGANASYLKILSTAIHLNTIYGLTESTVYYADSKNPNIVNYEYWKAVTGLPGSGKFQKIFSFANKLLLFRGGKLYKREADNTWTQLLSSINISSISVSNGRIIASNGTNTIYILNESFQSSSHDLINSPEIKYDNERDTYWAAGGPLGVISFKLQGNGAPIVNYFKPNGPAENIPWSMTFAGEKLFMVNGGRWENQYNRPGQVMIHENGQWKNIGWDIIKQETKSAVLDFVNVAIDPEDNTHFFVTSYGTGLYEFRNNQFFKWYNSDTPDCTIETAVSGAAAYLYIRLDGATFDKDRNLFLANMASPNPIKILTNDGEWKQLNFASFETMYTIGKILISNKNQNQKWVPSIRVNPGILVWDDNGTLTDQSDDKKVFLSKFTDTDNVGSYIKPEIFNCLTQDKNGVVWAGTDLGPLLFYNPNKVFDTDYTCSRVKIPRNDGTGLADYLLEDENIKAIVVDGANRKWIGTETSGLYLMSENGQETINHFTSANSPLLSDNILSLAINPVSGELFIGTSNGIISYQSNAGDANNSFTDVYSYPNPVRENFNGIITITGLVANTQVKITDINGNLIYQTVSNGKLATWDGKDLHGKRVNTGIYMVICASEDGTQNAITKIMVIN